MLCGYSRCSGMQRDSSTDAIIYLDYGKVYNAYWHTKSDLEQKKQFLQSLKQVDAARRQVKLRLLCFIDEGATVDELMADLVITGFTTYFDEIVLTSHGTSQQRWQQHMQNVKGSDVVPNDFPSPECIQESFEPVPARRYCKQTGEVFDQGAMTRWALANMYSLPEAQQMWNQSQPYQANYIRYYGGKDEYILQRYQEECECRRQLIVYVDHNATAMRSVQDLAEVGMVPVVTLWYPRCLYSPDVLYQRVCDVLQDDGAWLYSRSS